MDERSSEISEAPQQPLNDGQHELPTPANPRTMFFLLLPAGTWIANVIGARMASSAGPDTNDIGSACFLVALLPVWPVCLIAALRQAKRKKNGPYALFVGLIWNILLVAAVWVIMSMALEKANRPKAPEGQAASPIHLRTEHP